MRIFFIIFFYWFFQRKKSSYKSQVIVLFFFQLLFSFTFFYYFFFVYKKSLRVECLKLLNYSYLIIKFSHICFYFFRDDERVFYLSLVNFKILWFVLDVVKIDFVFELNLNATLCFWMFSKQMTRHEFFSMRNKLDANFIYISSFFHQFFLKVFKIFFFSYIFLRCHNKCPVIDCNFLFQRSSTFTFSDNFFLDGFRNCS